MTTKPCTPCSLRPHRLQQFYPFFTCSEQMGLTTRHICLSVTSLKSWSLETDLHLKPWNFSGFRFLYAWKSLDQILRKNFISKRERYLSRQINGRALNNVRIVTVRVIAVRGGGWGGSCGRPWQQSPRGGKLGGKMSVLNEKIDYLHSANSNLLRRIYIIQKISVIL
jgi:hypothetical protein